MKERGNPLLVCNLVYVENMMKTLIINGSPRKGGDTEALINEFVKHIEGDVKIVCWKDDISPCVDCRWCWKNSGCAVKDGMQEVYEYLTECDNVVLASPIWFSSLSGPVLDIASRFQTNFNGWFRRDEKIPVDKNGVLILVGAQPGTEEVPEQNAITIMRNMYVARGKVIVLKSMNTDDIPAVADASTMAAVRACAEHLNSIYCE